MNNLDKYIDRFFKVGLVIVLGFIAFQSQSSILGAQSNFSGPLNSLAGFQESGTAIVDTNGNWVNAILTSSTARFDNTATFNSSTFNGEITLGNCGTATWNPGAVSSSTSATTTIWVPNAAAGDIFLFGFSATTTDGAGNALVPTIAIETSTPNGVSTTVQLSYPLESDGTVGSINASSGTATVCYLN